jgi:hypothetical protein
MIGGYVYKIYFTCSFSAMTRLNSAPIGHPPTILNSQETKLLWLKKKIQKRLEKGLKVVTSYFEKLTRD